MPSIPGPQPSQPSEPQPSSDNVFQRAARRADWSHFQSQDANEQPQTMPQAFYLTDARPEHCAMCIGCKRVLDVTLMWLSVDYRHGGEELSENLDAWCEDCLIETLLLGSETE